MNTKSFRIRVNKNTENAKTRPICGLAALLFVIFISAAAEAASQPIEILTFEYPPYINGDGTGMGEKIVTASFQTQGYSVKFSYYPLKRAIKYFQDGRGQLFLGVRAYFPEQDVDFAELLYFRRVLVYLNEQYPTFAITSLGDLKGKRIGVTLGSSQIPLFQEAGLIVDTAVAVENNVKKLYAKRVDMIYALDLSAISAIEQFFPEQHADFGFFEYKRDAVDLVVRKNSPEEKILQGFSTGLKMIIGNGTYIHIMEERYGTGKVPDSAQVKYSEIK